MAIQLWAKGHTARRAVVALPGMLLDAADDDDGDCVGRFGTVASITNNGR